MLGVDVNVSTAACNQWAPEAAGHPAHHVLVLQALVLPQQALDLCMAVGCLL